MKKNDLIKLLQSIEGNPDMVLWNGTVGDYQDIDKKLVAGDLVKMTLKHYLESCLLEACREKKDFSYKHIVEEVAELTKSYRKVCKWETNNYVTQRHIDEKMYSSKRVFYIQPKVKGETSWDRYGGIAY